MVSNTTLANGKWPKLSTVMLQGDKPVASHGKRASLPSPIQHVSVIPVGAQSALKPRSRQLTPPFCTYSSAKARQSSNPARDNEGILPFHLKCWQLSHRWLRAAAAANAAMGVCAGTPAPVQHIVGTSTPCHSSAHTAELHLFQSLLLQGQATFIKSGSSS